MLKELLIQIVLFSLPEAIALAALAGILAEKNSGWKKILMIGVILGVLSPLWRLLFNSYLINTLLYLAVLATLLTIWGIGSGLFSRILSALLAISVYLAVEFINLQVFDVLWGFDPVYMLDKPGLRYSCFLIQFGIVFSAALVLKKYKFSLFDEINYEES